MDQLTTTAAATQPPIEKELSYSLFNDTLPPEIVSRIFYFTAPSYDMYQSKASPSQHWRPHSIPLTLAAVCHRWKAITWVTPALWSFSVLDLEDIPEPSLTHYLEIAESWLSRSGSLPLSIVVLAYDSDTLTSEWSISSLTSFLLPYWSRCADLELQVEFKILSHLCKNLHLAKNLHSLSVKCRTSRKYTGIFVDPPTFHSLRKVSLSQIYLNSFSIDWRLITNVSLQRFYLDEIFEILSSTENLVHLDVRAIIAGGGGYSIPKQPIHLPYLQYFDWQGCDDRTFAPSEAFCSKLDLPALRVLRITAARTYMTFQLPPYFDHFILDVAASLRTVIIGNFLIPEDRIFALWSSSPHLDVVTFLPQRELEARNSVVYIDDNTVNLYNNPVAKNRGEIEYFLPALA